MRVQFFGQVPKDLNYPEATEDRVEIALGVGRLAISDGASESFDSKTWAQLLVKAFTRSPNLTPDSLLEAIRQYNALYNLSTLSWSKHAAFERGSFATLLGVEELSAYSTISVFCVGDSLAVLLAGSEMIDSFPYSNSQQFQTHPELFCTNLFQNRFLGESDFSTHHNRIWNLKQLQSPVVLCMTDALGEWALKMAEEGSPQWETLISIKDTVQLKAIVVNEREHRRMRVDDVTLVSITFDEIMLDELSHA